jgi:6-phosphogluconolactonase
MPHLTSQGSVVLTGDGRHLLVTNAASDDVSVFSIGAEGTPSSMGTISVGSAPKSIAEHEGLVLRPGPESRRSTASGSGWRASSR